MDKSRSIWRIAAKQQPTRSLATISRTTRRPQDRPWICTQCLHHKKPQPIRHSRRHQSTQSTTSSTSSTQPVDQPGFTSILDNPPVLVRAGRRHNRWGLALLAAMPITAFLLGCWQVKRLGWKSELIAQLEDRILRDPLPLPPTIDPDAIKDFDYRRVYARGKFRHDQEMLLGPRIHDGEDGFFVITPLERTEDFPDAKGNTTILINRGWIPKDKKAHEKRPEGLPQGQVVVQGLLREPFRKNMFTPDNHADKNEWYFPDVIEMASHTNSQVVLIEETMTPDLLATYNRIEKGIPIGRVPEVNLRNKHAEYIFTWFSLAAATSVMLWMVIKKPATTRRIRQNTQW